jgi:Uma2 family endonuclease
MTMSIVPPLTPSSSGKREVEYPTGDGRPLAETPVHRDNLVLTIKILERWFRDEPMVYVSGNMLMYYEPGNKRRHVAPDVFVTRGIPKDKPRKSYFVWEEEHGPDMVIELTSKSTRKEDTKTKFVLYRDTLQVSEYFLFDPFGEYLRPPLQGYRLKQGEYVPMELVDGRLKSDVVGVEFEAHGIDLWVFDPETGNRLLRDGEALATAEEKLNVTEERLNVTEEKLNVTEERLNMAEEQLVVSDRQLADFKTHRQQLTGALASAQDELDRLRRELDEMRRRGP